MVNLILKKRCKNRYILLLNIQTSQKEAVDICANDQTVEDTEE
jgi:hypothetical protein